MFSSLTQKSKHLFTLALILGVLLMPISPLVAEEINDIAPNPIVPADIIAENISPEPLLDEPSIEEIVTEEVIPTPEPVVEIAEPVVIEASPVVEEVVASAPESTQEESVFVAENDFSTLAEDSAPVEPMPKTESEEAYFQTLEESLPPVVDDNLAISDEYSSVESNDNLAISEELFGETMIENIENPWAVSEENSFFTFDLPVDTVGIGIERSFNTLSLPVDTLVISLEQSFVTQIVPASDPVISLEQTFVTLPIIANTLAISQEQNFVTSSTPIDVLTISPERSFITLSGGSVVDPAIGPERSFITSIEPIDTLTISSEQDFLTLDNPVVETLAISDEFSFDTLSLPDDNLAISDELSFVTLDNSTSDTLAISDEFSFVTTDDTVDDLTVSGENNFVTQTGGGGGGGSGGGLVLGEQVYSCPIYLKKFIKYGENNDRREVIKLQAFLKVFEGFDNLKLTGVYDRPTYEAVKIFQSRYLRDVLRPWAITDSTGFVYITTRLAINNIYCGRDTANNLRFRERVAYEYYQATGEKLDSSPEVNPTDGYYLFPTSTPTTTETIVRPNVFLAGVGELLDFIGRNFCWLLNLLLLLLILFLLWLLWQVGQDDDSSPDEEIATNAGTGLADLDVPLPPVVSLEELEDSELVTGFEDEEILTNLAEADEIKMEKLDNNPWQEPIPLAEHQEEPKTL